MSVMPTRCVTEARWLSRGMFSWVDWAKLALAASSTVSATGRSRLYTGIPPQDVSGNGKPNLPGLRPLRVGEHGTIRRGPVQQVSNGACPHVGIQDLEGEDLEGETTAPRPVGVYTKRFLVRSEP